MLKRLVLAGVVGLAIVGCGGGSSVDKEAKKLEKIVIDDSNKKDVVVVANSRKLLYKYMVKDFINDTIKRYFYDTYSSFDGSEINYREIAISITGSGSIDCSDGGKIDYNLNNTIGTVEFKECKIENATLNGKIESSLSDDKSVYKESIKEFKYTYEVNETNDYSKDEYYIKNYKLTRTKRKTASGASLRANNEIAIREFQYNNKVTLEEGYYRYKSNDDGEKENYEVEYKDISMEYDTREGFSIEGYVKSSCIGGWIEIKSLENFGLIDEKIDFKGKMKVFGKDDTSLLIEHSINGNRGYQLKAYFKSEENPFWTIPFDREEELKCSR
jgi:hypothetical protein